MRRTQIMSSLRLCYLSQKPLLLILLAISLSSRTLAFSSSLRISPNSKWRLFSGLVPNVEISPSDHGTLPLTNFQHLDKLLVKTLNEQGWTIPTAIQANAIPLLEAGKDAMASSQTGSGKSLMFCLPLVQTLLLVHNTTSLNKKGGPSALIVSPTRELAMQTANVLTTLCQLIPDLRISLATGGANLPKQRQQLASSNILVGTPGRILQFIDERQLSLRSLQYLVIDEADRLLDLGFEPQLTRVARSLRNTPHQSIMCSATFPQGVQRIAADFLKPDYYFVSIGRVGSTHARIQQRFEWADSSNAKEQAVVRHVRDFRTANRESKQGSVIVFTNTKEDAERYGNALRQHKLNSRVIHGDKLQWERNLALKEFQRGQVPILVATDVAARGLDIASIGLVVQADAPRNLDTYTHRVRRTGRAGASGIAVMLLNWKSLGIANGLLDLLHQADQSAPAWIVGMAHVSRARQLEEDQQLVGAGREQIMETSEVNENFSGQDFRRTAVEGSYGAGRDTSYRSFDDEAYSNENPIDEKGDLKHNEDEATILDSGSTFNEIVDCNVEMETTLSSRSDSFRRETPSKSLVETFRRISGDKELGNQPDERVLQSLSKKGSDQRLRFEYLGMFSFDILSPFLMRTKDEGRRDGGMPRILMVAEKPSIAKAIADALSGRRGPRQRRGISRALPVYEFTSTDFEPLNTENGIPTRCLITVTSVVGHIFSLGFDTHNQTRPDPADFFRLPVAKKEEGTSSKLRVVDHLRALAGDSDHLVLWLDCDPEGENIAHEVIAVTRRAIGKRGTGDVGGKIHRARFSAINQDALIDSFSALEEPDAALSRSVDARQELDLRIGVALTRLLTWRCVGLARKCFDPSTRLVSYGPCQTPTLSLCVDRAREIEVFKAKQYWKVNVVGNILGSSRKSLPLKWKVPKEELVVDTRNKRRRTKADKASTIEENASFSKNSAEQVVKAASEPHAVAVVVEIKEKSESMPAPLGLNTIALLEAGSKAMGMSPKQVMNVAEKLYSAGFISYPRTETTKYDPNGFDVRSALREHSKHEAWGRSAAYLLRTKYSKSGRPPVRGIDVGDHPPITPLKVANRQDVGGGAAWRVYEFVVRNFIGSLHNDLSFSRRIVSLELESGCTDQFMPNHEFQFDLVTVDSLGFADCCRWVLNDIGAAGRKDDEFSFEEGQRIPISKASVEAATTRPPQFLQEHELIRLMDEHRIGTDASMAVHVSNIIDRGYVVLCDETGEPLRPPRPPRPGQKPHPRQIGRYMVPTALGTSLFNLFGQHIEGEASPALIAKPSIRSQMEEEVKQIALGTLDKDDCLQKNLEWFEARFQELERSLSRERLVEFGGSLCPTQNSLRFWRQLGAFEPKEKNVPKSQVPKARKKVGRGSVSSANPKNDQKAKAKKYWQDDIDLVQERKRERVDSESHAQKVQTSTPLDRRS